jgi:histidinol-phosphate aminotransferase
MAAEVRDDLGLMAGYHSPQVDAAVRLNTNESPFPPPAAFLEALADELGRVPLHRYPDRAAADLREAIAALHGVKAEQVWCANGSNEVLQTLLLAYGGPGRSAAVFEPTYALHSHIARLTGTAVFEGERTDDFRLDMAEVNRVVHRGRPDVTFLCSPNNPTGEALAPEVVAEVLDLAPSLVVVDEAYGQFSPWTALSLISEERPLVVTRTYSKTWSLAALRLGYAIAPSWVVEGMAKASLPYHLDAVKQVAGRLALRFTDDMERRVAALVEERGRLAGALAELPVDTWPSAANFILFRPRHKAGGEVWASLLERSVLVRDCSAWPRLTDCLRVTVGSPDENAAFLTALREVLA